MTCPSLELQKAIRTALLADGALAAFFTSGVKFFDHVPERQGWPYIVYREGDHQDASSASVQARQHAIQLSIFATPEGHSTPRQIANAIWAVLNNASLSPTGHSLIYLLHEGDRAIGAADGKVYNIVSRYRALTEETP